LFTITGTVNGRAVSLSWKDGVLSGDRDAIGKANHENIQSHGYLGLVPSGDESDYLSGELSAYDLLASHVFESVISEENDWEPFDPEAVY